MGLLENILRRAGYYKAQELKRPIPQHMAHIADTERWELPDYSLYANQASLYQKLSWINAGIGLVARTAASTQLNVMQYNDERETDIISHDFEDLLRRPNPLQSRREFLEASFSNYLLTGNCYWWLNLVGGRPVEIWNVRPSNILPVPDEQSYLSGYAFKTGHAAEPIPLPLEEVVHFKTYHPNNDFVGLSLMESIAVVAEGDLAMQHQNTRTYKDEGGRLPSILAFAEMVNDTEWTKIKKDVRTNEAKRQMMMIRGTGTGAVQWLQNAMSQQDMQYLESRTFTKEEIWSVIAPGLSSMLAINANEANSRTGKAIFSEFAIYPLHCAFAEKVTNDLLPLYADDLICEFEDVRQSDQMMELQEQDHYARTHTIDEIREKYYGDDPIGDERGVLLPAQVSPMTPRELVDEPMVMDADSTEPQAEPEEQDDSAEEQQQESEQASGYDDEIKAWERKALNRMKGQKALDFTFESERIPERVKRIAKAALADCQTADDIREVFASKAIIRQRDPDEPRRQDKETLEDKITKVMLSYWKRQNVLVRERLGNLFPMATKAEVTFGIDILDSDDELEKLQAALMRLLVYAATDAVDLFSELIRMEIDYTLTNAEAAAWATRYTGELVKGIDETTLQTLRYAVADFVDTPGMTIADVMARLPYSERRARMIAVTEVTNAYASGQAIAGDALAEQFPGVTVVKTWFTNNDDRVCDICGPVHNQTVDINDAFSNGLIKPPAHPYCRCWVSYNTRIA